MNLIPDADSVFWKVGRLKTFKNWPFQSPKNVCNPEKMAAAGFVSIGNDEEPDLVECFICLKQLDGWDPDDDPWSEHTKHQNDCAFVKLNKQNEEEWTVYDLFDLFRKYSVKGSMRDLENAKIKAKEESVRLASGIPEIYKGLRKMRKDIS